MVRFALLALLGASALGTSAGAQTTLDFTSMANGTVATNQFAGVEFSLQGGPTSATAPVVTGVFGDSTTSLTNSSTNDYPTANILLAHFTGAGASNVSFTFNNYGNDNGSHWTAYDAAHNVVSSGDLSNQNSWTDIVSVSGAGITDLAWDNGSGGDWSWQFGVGQLSYTSGAVPEPASWALMLGGFGLVGGAMRRRSKAAVSVA